MKPRMKPLRPSSGIAPHETDIEEIVLETTLTFVGGLLGAEIPSKHIFILRLDECHV